MREDFLVWYILDVAIENIVRRSRQTQCNAEEAAKG